MRAGTVRVEDVIRYIADQYTKHERLVPYWLKVGDVPRVDAVEVVRCRDCIHYESDGGAMMICNVTDMVCDYDEYCSCGERREDGEA